MASIEAQAKPLWTELDALFKEANTERIFHVIKKMLIADLDLDQLARSAQLLADLHIKNKGDSKKLLARGYGILICMCHLKQGKTALAVSSVQWLKKCPQSEKLVSQLEEMIAEDSFVKSKTAALTPLTNEKTAAASSESSFISEQLQKDFAPLKDPLPPLKQIELFSQILNAKEFQSLIEKVKIRNLKPNDLLFKEGDPAHSFYVVAKGELEFSNSLGVQLDFKDHDFFGEIGILTKLNRTGTVRAKEDTQLLEFSKELLLQTFIQFPKLEERLLGFLDWRLFLNVAARSPWFSGFDLTQLKDFYNYFEPHFIRAGKPIFQEGKQSSSLLLLTSGQISIARGGSEIAVANPGDFLGEIGLLNQSPRTATVTTKSDCRFLICKDYLFESLCKMHPPVKDHLVKISEMRVPILTTALSD